MGRGRIAREMKDGREREREERRGSGERERWR